MYGLKIHISFKCNLLLKTVYACIKIYFILNKIYYKVEEASDIQIMQTTKSFDKYLHQTTHLKHRQHRLGKTSWLWTRRAWNPLLERKHGSRFTGLQKFKLRLKVSKKPLSEQQRHERGVCRCLFEKLGWFPLL